MIIKMDISLERFEGWQGARRTIRKLDEHDKLGEVESILEDMYPDGMDEGELNDLLWFSAEEVFGWVGLDEDGEEPQEDEDEEDNDND